MSALQERVTLPTGLTTIAYKWLPMGRPRALVVGIHGFAEHAGRYKHVGRFLAERGFALYMYDLRGHGRSEWERGYVDRFEQFVEDTVAFAKYAKREVPAKTFLLGHSMGGLIAVYAVARLGGELNGFLTSGAALEVKVNPLARFTLQLAGLLNPRGRVRTPVATDCLSKDKSVIERYMSDPLVFKDPTYKLFLEFGRAVQRVWRVVGTISLPALIMHGGSDCLVPPSASRKLYEKLPSPDKKLKIYEGLRHEIFNEVEREEVLTDLADWLSARAS